MHAMFTAWSYMTPMANMPHMDTPSNFCHGGSTGGGGRAWEHHCTTGIYMSMPAGQQFLRRKSAGGPMWVRLVVMAGIKPCGKEHGKAYLDKELCWSSLAWQWKTSGRFSDILPALIHLWHGRGSWQKETSGLSPAISAEREQRVKQKHYRESRIHPLCVSRSRRWLSSGRIPGCFAWQWQLSHLGWLQPAVTAQSSVHRL